MFKGQIEPFENKIWLSSPTMHGEELEYIKSAYETNWMSTVGENINAVEQQLSDFLAGKKAVALSSGTAALHMALRLAGQKMYGKNTNGEGVLAHKKVFCSDMTFAATVNPIVYEGGEPVFIDSEYESWNMDPEALERAFELFPDVKIIVVVHLYGVPANMERIRKIADQHGAIIVEDAAESLGATYLGRQTGTLGDIGVISFNGNKIITGSSGGAIICNDDSDAGLIRKWSTQSREAAPWYQHEDLGYNYRMSNVIAGVVRGQLLHLQEHIQEKKAIYYRYKEGLKNLPIKMNSFDENTSVPNYWLSCMLIDANSMCGQIRTANATSYQIEDAKSCPDEILDIISKLNAEGRPIWKPMHLQPIFQENTFVSVSGEHDAVSDIFARGLCLPSDNKMTAEQQDRIIECIRKCFE